MLTGCAPCSAYRALDESASQELGTQALSQRVGWLAGLTSTIAQGVLGSSWDEQTLTWFNRDTTPDGQPTPRKAYVAVRRHQLGSGQVAGLYIPDRVYRMGQEHAGQLLRSAGYRQQVLDAILRTWPDNPLERTQAEWDRLRTAAPGVVTAELRNRTRQIVAFMGRQQTLPAGLCELETTPRVAPMALAAAADRQAVTLTRLSADRALLRILLPRCEQPRARRDWSWVLITFNLPPTVPADSGLHTPSLRALPCRVAIDMPFDLPAPSLSGMGHLRAVGLDWGVCTFLLGAVGQLTTDESGHPRVVTDGRQLRFDPAGPIRKWEQLRLLGNHLRKQIGQLEKIVGDKQGHPADRKLAVLRRENLAVCARQRNLGHAIAWSAARWAVNHALAAGATAVYVEDLGTLEPAFDRKQNVKIAGSVRGQFQHALIYLAAKEGIVVVLLPAGGTSSGCPWCLQPLAHWTSPQRTKRGYHWAGCTHCPLSRDRDQAASWRVVARGLASQPFTRRDRKTGRFSVTQHRDLPVTVLPTHKPVPPTPGPDTARADTTDTDVAGGKVKKLYRPRVAKFKSGSRRSRYAGNNRARTHPQPKPKPRSKPKPAGAVPAQAAPVATVVRSVPLRRCSALPVRGLGGRGRPASGGTVPAVSPHGASQDGSIITRFSDVAERRKHEPRWARLGGGFHRNAYATPVRAYRDGAKGGAATLRQT